MSQSTAVITAAELLVAIHYAQGLDDNAEIVQEIKSLRIDFGEYVEACRKLYGPEFDREAEQELVEEFNGN